jgi:dihydrofolate reductase
VGNIQVERRRHFLRKVIVPEFVSLDGVMEDPRWTFRFMSEERENFKFDELSASDALLLGRVTYEGFAAAWPNMTEQAGEYAEMMNGYPKYVVSTTLEEPPRVEQLDADQGERRGRSPLAEAAAR